MPQLEVDRAPYSWIDQPHVCSSGNQQRPGETIRRRLVPASVVNQW